MLTYADGIRYLFISYLSPPDEISSASWYRADDIGIVELLMIILGMRAISCCCIFLGGGIARLSRSLITFSLTLIRTAKIVQNRNQEVMRTALP